MVGIGFIGLGDMGRPMALRLLQAGHSVRVFARRAAVFETEALQPLLQAGAQPCASLSELVCDPSPAIVITNVFSTQDVEEVTAAVAACATSSITFVDHSTIDPAGARRIAQQLAARTPSHIFVDAPVSGGTMGAAAGSLAMFVGCSTESVLPPLMPVLSCYAASITRMGPVGSGAATKLCNQIAQIITIQGIAETVRFAQTQGVDSSAVITAISQGMAGSKMMDLLGPRMARGDFSKVISARLHAKDATLARAAADEAHTALPALEVVERQFQRLLSHGWGDDDSGSLLRVLQSASQVQEQDLK